MTGNAPMNDGLHFIRLGHRNDASKTPVALFEFVAPSLPNLNAAFSAAHDGESRADDIRSKHLADAAHVTVKSRNMTGLDMSQIKQRLKTLEPNADKLPQTIAALRKGMEQLTNHKPAHEAVKSRRLNGVINSM